jgi:NADPH:quinone reductase-like Zn-dependent oxidoreductase
MTALVRHRYGGTHTLSVQAVRRPAPREHEVVLEVAAAGLDRGAWHLMTGRPYLLRLARFGVFAPRQPVLGTEVSGTVVEVGSGVTRWSVGDRVFGYAEGAFAPFAVARADKLAAAPASLPLEEAALLAVSGSTALQALTDGGAKASERVLIVGASGGVGTYAVQIAKALGLHVTAVCSAAKASMVRRCGAHRVIDRHREDFTAAAERYDLVIDVAGGTPLSRLRRVMTHRGRLVFVGNEEGGDWTAGFERQIHALLVRPFTRQRFVMLLNREQRAPLEELARLVEAGQVRPVIDRRVALGDVPEAVDALAAGRVAGKVLVSVA